jgi:PPK2 family polyphosphate:nucleotide phosphotransferase
MFEAPASARLVPFDGSFAIAQAPTAPPAGAAIPKKSALASEVRRIAEMQRILYADDRHAVLLVFQAMDAAGKDGTIRAVLTGVNPAGCQVTSFGPPSSIELDHDFLWRTTRKLPERGRIGVFNRSYYEEVLIVRVHPEILAGQRLPAVPAGPELFAQRFESIRTHETHLARNGVVVLKFFLHVSRDEQRRRFLSRLRTPRKHWKFAASDVAEAGHWAEYMAAYEDALNATSRPSAPWYAIPADNKPYMRWQVAAIVADAIESLGLKYPAPDAGRKAEIERMKRKLTAAARAADGRQAG